MGLKYFPLSVLFCLIFGIGCSDSMDEQPKVFTDNVVLVTIDLQMPSLISVTRSDTFNFKYLNAFILFLRCLTVKL